MIAITNYMTHTNKTNKWFQAGCDYCGEAKIVRKLKSGKQGNWMHVYACNVCKPEAQNIE